MKRLLWAGVVIVVAGGCAGAYESRRVTPAATDSAPPAVASSSQPGCREPSHQPFPASGSYVPVDELAEPVTKVPPEYPAVGREQGVQGTVLLRALVCEHGRVVKTEVVQSVPLLDEAAAYAVMQWTFRPARSGGRPVAVWVDTPVRFTIH